MAVRPYLVNCSKCGVQYNRNSPRKFVCRACKGNGYPRHFYYNRKIVLERDENTCQCCGTQRGLILHHLDCDRQNNSTTNLITLCKQCHAHLHRTYDNPTLRRGNIYKLFPDVIRFGKFGKVFRPQVINRKQPIQKPKRVFKRLSSS